MKTHLTNLPDDRNPYYASYDPETRNAIFDEGEFNTTITVISPTLTSRSYTTHERSTIADVAHGRVLFADGNVLDEHGRVRGSVSHGIAIVSPHCVLAETPKHALTFTSLNGYACRQSLARWSVIWPRGFTAVAGSDGHWAIGAAGNRIAYIAYGHIREWRFHGSDYYPTFDAHSGIITIAAQGTMAVVGGAEYLATVNGPKNQVQRYALPRRKIVAVQILRNNGFFLIDVAPSRESIGLLSIHGKSINIEFQRALWLSYASRLANGDIGVANVGGYLSKLTPTCF